jgi:hypothetical protein
VRYQKPRLRRRRTAEPRITILLGFLACSIDWASLPGAVEQAGTCEER